MDHAPCHGYIRVIPVGPAGNDFTGYKPHPLPGRTIPLPVSRACGNCGVRRVASSLYASVLAVRPVCYSCIRELGS